MSYGNRLLMAMQARGDALGQTIARKDVAKVASVSVQNIGMILKDAMKRDQKLGTEAHAAVAAYLKVNSRWLLTGEGPMAAMSTLQLPTELSAAATELAVLFDMIPVTNKIARAKAFNGASSLIMQLLEAVNATPQK